MKKKKKKTHTHFESCFVVWCTSFRASPVLLQIEVLKCNQTMASKMEPSCAGKMKYELKYDDLVKYTDNFSEENFLGTFQFGKVYRGKIEQFTHEIQHVMVKIWEVPEIYVYYKGDNEARLMHEVTLLRHEKLISHPGMIELYGYCWDGKQLGAVYNFKPLDIVHNLVPKDSFTWLQRIKVAVGFARLLKFLHTGDPQYKPFLVRNIAAAHIVVDEEYNPKLYDFGLISGGIFPDRTIYKCYYLLGVYGYIDQYVRTGKWSTKTDVFAFGVILLNLITKRVLTEEERRSSDVNDLLDFWAWDHYKCKGVDTSIEEPLFYSFVDQSLTTDPDFSYTDGRKITKLAMKCISGFPDQRPSMKQVMKHLLKLQIVKKHAEFLGLGPKLPAGVDG